MSWLSPSKVTFFFVSAVIALFAYSPISIAADHQNQSTSRPESAPTITGPISPDSKPFEASMINQGGEQTYVAKTTINHHEVVIKIPKDKHHFEAVRQGYLAAHDTGLQRNYPATIEVRFQGEVRKAFVVDDFSSWHPLEQLPGSLRNNISSSV